MIRTMNTISQKFHSVHLSQIINHGRRITRSGGCSSVCTRFSRFQPNLFFNDADVMSKISGPMYYLQGYSSKWEKLHALFNLLEETRYY